MFQENIKSELIQFKVDKNTKSYIENRAKELKGNIADYMRLLIDQDFEKLTEI